MPKFIALLVMITAQLALAGYSPEKSTFALSLNGRADNYRVRAVTVLPEETLTFRAERAGRAQTITVDGGASAADGDAWTWRAPTDPGVFPLNVRRGDSQEVVLVNVFVMAPYEWMERGHMNGYPIGEYPAGRSGAYARPRGFVEVTEETANTLVSPHFTLKQFLCKQAAGYPKYLVLSEALLGKLERVLEKVNAEGAKASTLAVMSGYRTPHYNRALGNVKLSRHQYGDAADVFPDELGRGHMQDLNGDGKIDFRDSLTLRRWVEQLENVYPTHFPTGGIGVYENTRSHGPFVHIDARGHAARWANNAKRFVRRVKFAVTNGKKKPLKVTDESRRRSRNNS